MTPFRSLNQKYTLRNFYREKSREMCVNDVSFWKSWLKEFSPSSVIWPQLFNETYVQCGLTIEKWERSVLVMSVPGNYLSHAPVQSLEYESNYSSQYLENIFFTHKRSGKSAVMISVFESSQPNILIRHLLSGHTYSINNNSSALLKLFTYKNSRKSAVMLSVSGNSQLDNSVRHLQSSDTYPLNIFLSFVLLFKI